MTDMSKHLKDFIQKVATSLTGTPGERHKSTDNQTIAVWKHVDSPHLRIIVPQSSERVLRNEFSQSAQNSCLTFKSRGIKWQKIRTSERHPVFIYIHQWSLGWWAKPVSIVTYEHVTPSCALWTDLRDTFLVVPGSCLLFDFLCRVNFENGFSDKVNETKDHRVPFQLLTVCNMLTRWESVISWYHRDKKGNICI